MEYAPVCANGTTYGNQCSAECIGVTDFAVGECPNHTTKPAAARSCDDWQAWQPVCVDGKYTVRNECIARASGGVNIAPGECVNGWQCSQAGTKMIGPNQTWTMCESSNGQKWRSITYVVDSSR